MVNDLGEGVAVDLVMSRHRRLGIECPRCVDESDLSPELEARKRLLAFDAAESARREVKSAKARFTVTTTVTIPK